MDALHNLALAEADAHAGNGPWDDDLHTIPAPYLDAGGEFLVGTLVGEVVAIGALRPHDGYAEIKRMRVHPRHQRNGFGAAILSRLEIRARELGFPRLRLDTTTGQTDAQALYRAHGWQLTNDRARIGRFDVVFFEKRLA